MAVVVVAGVVFFPLRATGGPLALALACTRPLRLGSMQPQDVRHGNHTTVHKSAEVEGGESEGPVGGCF